MTVIISLCEMMVIMTIRLKPLSFPCILSNRELLETTCRLANTLKSHGIKKGDTVAIYMPVSPLAVAALLACARIGAVHTVVFAGFSSEALAGRIQDGKFRFPNALKLQFHFLTFCLVTC